MNSWKLYDWNWTRHKKGQATFSIVKSSLSFFTTPAVQAQNLHHPTYDSVPGESFRIG